MKKIILIFLLLTLTSCTQTKEKIIENKKIIIEEEPKEIYQDNNQTKIGIYNNRNLITEYRITQEPYYDIGSFEIYETDLQTLPNNNQKELFNKYYNNNYKIGYNIKYTLKDNTNISLNILKPIDRDPIFNHIQIYLYDDINQTKSYYSHLEQNEFNENSILSSIKLTRSIYFDEIISPIILTAFTYDDDDFDSEGNYRGNSKYQITIIREY